MGTYLIVIVCMIAIIFVIYTCIKIGIYSECDSRIRFSTFTKLYRINPNRFLLRDSRVSYYNNGRDVDLAFTNPLETIRYKLFRRQIHKANKLGREKQLHADMLKNLQDDINKLLN